MNHLSLMQSSQLWADPVVDYLLRTEPPESLHLFFQNAPPSLHLLFLNKSGGHCFSSLKQLLWLLRHRSTSLHTPIRFLCSPSLFDPSSLSDFQFVAAHPQVQSHLLGFGKDVKIHLSSSLQPFLDSISLLSSLRTLKLDFDHFVRVSSLDFSPLSKLSSLRHLSVFGSQIDESKSVVHLSSSASRLTHLDFVDSGLGPGVDISLVFPDLSPSNLTHLQFKFNDPFLVRHLSTLCSLESLDIYRLPSDQEALASPFSRVCSSLSKLTFLSLQSGHEVSAHLLGVLPLARNLSSLRLLKISLSDAELTALSELSSLISLELNLVRITLDSTDFFPSLSRLERLRTLKILNVSNASSFSFLNSLPSLSSLTVEGLPGYSHDFSFADISNLRSLSHLHLARCPLLSKLSDFTTLKFLHISLLPNGPPPPSLGPSLSSLTRLRSLELFNTSTSFEWASSLLKLSSLRVVNRSATTVRPGLFRSLTRLQSLHLSALPSVLTEEEGQLLAASLPRLHTLILHLSEPSAPAPIPRPLIGLSTFANAVRPLQSAATGHATPFVQAVLKSAGELTCIETILADGSSRLYGRVK